MFFDWQIGVVYGLVSLCVFFLLKRAFFFATARKRTLQKTITQDSICCTQCDSCPLACKKL